MVVEEKLSTKARNKALADGPVVRDILDFLWRLDEYDYFHPRMRMQIVFALQLMHFVGLRPGEFVESSAYSNSNEGLLWGDVDIKMIADRNGCNFFFAFLSLRNRKGNRNNEGQVYVFCSCCEVLTLISLRPIEVLREDVKDRIVCPISVLLALALADDVLEDITKPADLARVRYQKGSNMTHIRIKMEKLELPILRRGVRGGAGISRFKMLKADSLTTLFTELGHRAGYKENLGTYALRRGYGNRLDSKSNRSASSRYSRTNACARIRDVCRAKPSDGPQERCDLHVLPFHQDINRRPKHHKWKAARPGVYRLHKINAREHGLDWPAQTR